MRVNIDRESCLGTGYCQRDAPELFEVGEDNIAHLREGVNPQTADPAKLRAAAEACPWRAITLEP